MCIKIHHASMVSNDSYNLLVYFMWLQSRPIFNKSTRFEDMRNVEDDRIPYRRPSVKKYFLLLVTSVSSLFYHVHFLSIRSFRFFFFLVNFLVSLDNCLIWMVDRWIGLRVKIRGWSLGTVILMLTCSHGEFRSLNSLIRDSCAGHVGGFNA